MPSAALQKPDSLSLLRTLSSLLGVLYTLSWSLSFYPQVLLNIRRRSTTGTTPSFPILNILGFFCYTVSILAFLYSPLIQQQYRDRHGGLENTARGNDLAFALHASILSIIALSQFSSTIWGFERRRWRVGYGVWGIIVSSFPRYNDVFGSFRDISHRQKR